MSVSLSYEPLLSNDIISEELNLESCKGISWSIITVSSSSTSSSTYIFRVLVTC